VTAAGAIDRVEIGADGLTFTGRACGPHDGRPVLLLHGFPQTSWAWRDALWALGTAGFRALAPDQRGYCPGARPTDPSAYATERLVADVLAVADALDMERFDLVGHDWGGMLGWIVAARHADRVRTLSVLSTPHPFALREVLGGADQGPVGHRQAMAQFVETGVPERLLGPDGNGGNLSGLLTESGLDEHDARMYVEALKEPGALAAALNWYRSMDTEIVRDLGPVTVPTLYVWSTGDRAFNREAAESTARHVRADYVFEVLDDVSHWIPETAADRLSSLVLAHLTAH
jgi:pimeloyl-ACP methyl ester carboxylesterase